MVQLNGPLLLFIVIFSPKALVSVSWNRPLSCSPSSPPDSSLPPTLPCYRHWLLLSSPPVLLHMPSSAAMAACCTRRDMHAGGEDRQNQPIRSAGRQLAVHFYQSLSMDDKLAPMSTDVGPDTPQTFRTLKLKTLK